MEPTLYRRPLPADTIAFSSREGRAVFAEALSAGGLGGYFPLAEQFHTQSEPAFCGLGSLVVALNALAIDPGRLWKGPWRWFGEELLDCCVPLAEVRERGLALDELGCLARCNGAEVEVVHADTTNLEAWTAALRSASHGESVLIASYDRAALGQTGSGHFSPIGGYHAMRDLALVLDVARFKYPPHWVSAERLWRAMQTIDASTDRTRGWMLLRPRAHGLALGFSLTCAQHSWPDLARRLTSTAAALGAGADVGALARAVVPLLEHLEVRIPTAPAHQEALAAARAAIRALPLHGAVKEAIGADDAEAATLLLLASIDLLLPEQRVVVMALAGGTLDESPFTAELDNLRAQLAALSEHARNLA